MCETIKKSLLTLFIETNYWNKVFLSSFQRLSSLNYDSLRVNKSYRIKTTQNIRSNCNCNLSQTLVLLQAVAKLKFNVWKFRGKHACTIKSSERVTVFHTERKNVHILEVQYISDLYTSLVTRELIILQITEMSLRKTNWNNEFSTNFHQNKLPKLLLIFYCINGSFPSILIA